jgi:uncharacterized protein (UPF0128 family)
MKSIKQWRVEVMLGEDDGQTYAEAHLVTEIGDRLVGVGRAHVGQSDYDVPEIGDEVAVARALSALGAKLLATASGDIGQVNDEHVRLTH